MTKPDDDVEYTPDDGDDYQAIDSDMELLPPEKVIRMGVGLKTVALLSLVAALACAMGGAVLSEAIRMNSGSADIKQLQGEVGALAEDNDQLNAKLVQTQAQLRLMNDRQPESLSTLEARLKTLEKARSKPDAAANKQIKFLESRLEKMESRPLTESGEVDVSADITQRIRALEEQSSPYEMDDILDRLDRLEVQSLSAPTQMAEQPKPSVTMVIIPPLPRADILAAIEDPDKKSSGWFGRTFKKHVSVRDAGTDSPQETLVKVQAHIEADDYANALAAFDTLPSRARSAGAEWRAAIEAQLETNK